MSDSAEVELSISIDIRTEGTVGIGLTVAQWNALTDKERSEIVRDAWESMATDNGGISVITPGAVAA